MLANNLVTFATSLSKDLMVQDVRIGLGYTCVELSDAVRASPGRRNPTQPVCTHLKKAGGLTGLPLKRCWDGWLRARIWKEPWGWPFSMPSIQKSNGPM